MTWSYSGDPSSSVKDAVRFEIGDTIQTDQQLGDEEIVHVISQHSNVLRAAAHCCRILAVSYARQADSSLGPQKVSASQRSKAYRELARDLELRIAGTNAPYAGGIEDETLPGELKKPAFTRDMMTNKIPGRAGE